MKWFVTDEISRIHGYGTTDNVLDEVEPNTVISFGGGNPFQTRGWRIRVQGLENPRSGPRRSTWGKDETRLYDAESGESLCRENASGRCQ